MKVLITGGGTGGHIYPAIAIANKIKEEIKNSDILFVGTKRGLESTIVPKEGFNFETITVSGFKRNLSIDTLKSVRDLAVGLKDAIKIIKSFRPDIIIGTGGFVCGPIVFIGSLLNIKTIIHEQNVIPGITNRILSKVASRILVSFDESRNYFKNDNKIIVTGNPVRKDFINVNRDQCRKELGIYDDRMVVMVFGGSRGAEKINETMIEILDYYNARSDIQIIHITGETHYHSLLSELGKRNIVLSKNIIIKNYVHNMSTLMGACDLVICRSGAITLAEITTMGLPSILIPSPHVTNNHQEHNAKVLEKNGAAILLTEKELSGNNIVMLLNSIMKDKKLLKTMGEKSREISKSNSTDNIYNNIIDVIGS